MELKELVIRVEEYEMAESKDSLRTKNIQDRHKVEISHLKSEYTKLQNSYLEKLKDVQITYQKELMRVEEAYLNKIEWYKANEKAIIEEWEIKLERSVNDVKETMTLEISRLTSIINLYREKLNKRENENRNLLVDVKLLKEKIETIRQEYIGQIEDLKEELRIKTMEWSITEKNLLKNIETLEITQTKLTKKIEGLAI